MSKKRVLFVTQEMEPYTVLSEISKVVRRLPQKVQEKGMEIRVLMPRYGTINERRHRLHEVVRLSGMNIIVDDEDYPLIIKVASLPGARMQVYFLDNDEFFRRKQVFKDEDGKPFDDNAERMVFFCKGVIETVKKFGWPPDIIHCHGWLTSLVPLYIKEAYAGEPLFQNSKVVYSVYNNDIEATITDEFVEKAQINQLEEENLNEYLNGSGVTLNHGAIFHADALVKGMEGLDSELEEKITSTEKPTLEFHDDDEFISAHLDFYQSLLENEE